MRQITIALFSLDTGSKVIASWPKQKVRMPNVEAIDNFLASIYHNQDVDGESTYVMLLTNVICHPILGFAALKYLRSFPVVKVTIPEAEKARTRWLFDPRRPWRPHGFIASYIELPSPLTMYFQGTAKQNLRTRMTHARVAGYQVRAVDALEINEVISQVFKDKGWEELEIEANLRKMGLRQVGESVVAPICVGVFDSSGHVVGFSLGTQTGNVVRTLLSFNSIRGSYRWLCFSGYVEEVSARGGRFIVESPPWAFTGGNNIFAGHLGFVPARIRSS